ncbi:MAG: hypothetical protein H0U13_02400, partial [Gemmatimonadaceae bacterium]|nr:hypothetical protein [Gemmatimonadaceae bacterium]
MCDIPAMQNAGAELAQVAHDAASSAGVVLNAATADCFTATLGGGAYLNGRRISVSSIDEPARALVGT